MSSNMTSSNLISSTSTDPGHSGLIGHLLSGLGWGWLATLVFSIYAFSIVQRIVVDESKAPIVGLRSILEPVFFARFRFTVSARDIVQDGYRKFKASWFRLARNDRDVVVLSTRYLPELRALPNTKLSAIQALISNLGYSQSELLLESDLHFQTLTKKVTPNLHVFISPMRSDLDEVMATFPKMSKDWNAITLHDLAEKLTERLSARVFVGEPACRDPTWLRCSTNYVHNASITVFIMRAVPGWLQPVVARLLPTYWRSMYWANKSIEYLVPIIQERRDAVAKDPSWQKPQDFLQGMLDLADVNDGANEKLARRALIMGLASLHLTTIAVEHILYDIWARPEYVEPLREELETVLAQDGGQWTKTTPGDLRKLDSFLRESQRLSPPSLLAMHRIVQSQPIKLSDGKVLNPGQHVCLPAYNVSTDANIVAGSDEFDGFRYYRMRESGLPDEAQKHQFSTIDHQHLHFGVGHNACPGRWFASLMLKMVVGEMLLRYDLQLPGHVRPANITIDEFIVVDPALKTQMRLRQ